RRNASDRFAIEYRVGDARRLTEVVEPGSFDAALCVLAIQNLTPLSPVWEGCWQALQPGGRLVVVLMHPCFRIPRSSHWGWDERAGRQYRRIERYLTLPPPAIPYPPHPDPPHT